MAAPMSSSSHIPTPPNELSARVSKVAGVVFVAFLALGFVSCTWLLLSGKVEMLPTKLTREAMLEGDVTHKIAKQLSKAAVPERAAELERGASWLMLRDTGPRVRSGCQGWLFLTDEMRINRHAQANAATKAGVVHQIQQRLAKRDITLLVAVVPDKRRIASVKLCELLRPAMRRAG